MAVFRLVYMSKRAPSAPLYIDDLISVSRQRNRQAGVTGFLVFDGQNFAQALEGKRREVTQIYNRIAADDRHYELHLVSCVDTAARLFPGWAMGLLSDIPPESRDRFLSFFALEQADPNDVPAERVLGLMQMLAVELSSQNTIEMVRDGKDGRYSHRRSPG